jgi:uncharacterized protein YfaS (alpha-2-macroglobulin family)
MPITAAGVGVAELDLRLTGPKSDLTQHFRLGIASAAPDSYRRTVTPLPGGGSQTISGDLLADFIPGTGSIAISASPFGALDAPALLAALQRYPYGCSEQTVSIAMPLLYANRLASVEHLGVDPDIDGRINQAIERQLSRQSASGAFGMWSADSNDNDSWLDAFVTDFLTRARERNFAAPSQAFEQALDRLRNEVVNTPEPNKDNSAAIAYALYVLARNGRPVIGDLRYLTDAKLEAFTTPLAKAQLAAALAMLGDQARAAGAFGAALKALEAERDGGSRPDYGSRLRDAAAILALVAESNLGGAFQSDAIARAGAVLDEARATRSYLSTQEMNWMTLAAEGLAEHASLAQFRVDGEPVKGALYRRWSGPTLPGRSIVIANAGQNPAELVVSVSGAPIEPDPPAAKGYAIERSFYKLDGTKLDALPSMAQNERVVVALKVTEAQARFARLLVVDRLPAGIEIDNPALVDSGSVEAFSWLSKDVEPTHTEYRDDRFVAAFDRAEGQSAFITMAYVVRAVAPGRYIYPPATAEDMYDPERYGRTGFGELEVKAK